MRDRERSLIHPFQGGALFGRKGRGRVKGEFDGKQGEEGRRSERDWVSTPQGLVLILREMK